MIPQRLNTVDILIFFARRLYTLKYGKIRVSDTFRLSCSRIFEYCRIFAHRVFNMLSRRMCEDVSAQLWRDETAGQGTDRTGGRLGKFLLYNVNQCCSECEPVLQWMLTINFRWCKNLKKMEAGGDQSYRAGPFWAGSGSCCLSLFLPAPAPTPAPASIKNRLWTIEIFFTLNISPVVGGYISWITVLYKIKMVDYFITTTFMTYFLFFNSLAFPYIYGSINGKIH